MKWVVVFNTNECKIFSFSKKNKELNLIKDISHPENKERNQDLVSDRPGRYSTDANAGGAYSQHTDPKEVKINQFVLEINRFLDNAHAHQQFDKLIIIAPPKIFGHLLQHMNKSIEKLIAHTVQKELTFMKDHELLAFLLNEI